MTSITQYKTHNCQTHNYFFELCVLESISISTAYHPIYKTHNSSNAKLLCVIEPIDFKQVSKTHNSLVLRTYTHMRLKAQCVLMGKRRKTWKD